LVSAATVEQVPGEVGSAQDWQVPVQAVVQQTPSTQKLLAHSLGAAHWAPGGFGPQVLLMQAVPVSQSATVSHTFVQTPSAQRKGWQSCTPGGRQVPSPSQVPAVLRRLPVQDEARHCVSLA
jgi:hypothetical protein